MPPYWLTSWSPQGPPTLAPGDSDLRRISQPSHYFYSVIMVINCAGMTPRCAATPRASWGELGPNGLLSAAAKSDLSFSILSLVSIRIFISQFISYISLIKHHRNSCAIIFSFRWSSSTDDRVMKFPPWKIFQSIELSFAEQKKKTTSSIYIHALSEIMYALRWTKSCICVVANTKLLASHNASYTSLFRSHKKIGTDLKY